MCCIQQIQVSVFKCLFLRLTSSSYLFQTWNVYKKDLSFKWCYLLNDFSAFIFHLMSTLCSTFCSSYSDRTLYIFCLHLMQFILFTNYVFKQIITYGRQFEFTQVKVVKLDVEHYDYNTSCGNNSVRHNYSDQAVCLPEF